MIFDNGRNMNSRTDQIKRSVLPRYAGEFTGSFLFSLLFFIFVYRYVSGDYNMSFSELSFYVGLAFLVSMFTPSYRYVVDVIPLITLIKLLEEGFTWKRFAHLPIQFAGSLLSIWVFLKLNACCLSNLNVIYDFHDFRYPVDDLLLNAFFNGLIVAVLYYLYYIVRYVFREREFSGTLFTSTVVCVLFFSTAWLDNISMLNPFGLLSYELFADETLHISAEQIFIHIVSPALFLLLSKLYININLVREYIGPKPRTERDSNFKNYDV